MKPTRSGILSSKAQFAIWGSRSTTRSAFRSRSSCELRRSRSWPCEKRIRDPPHARIPCAHQWLLLAEKRAVHHHGSKP
jgi:hypothetical protein